MKLGLLDMNDMEILYPGCARQEVEWSMSSSGTVHNVNRVDFPTIPKITGYETVYSVGVFRSLGGMTAVIPLAMQQHLVEGLTLTFLPGSLIATERMIVPSVVNEILFGKAGTAAKLPTNCKKCNHFNEYVGAEHLTAGEYICRSCKR